MCPPDEMAFFNNAHDFTVNGGSFIVVGQRGVGELSK